VEAFLDLVVASFVSLSPGSGGVVLLGKKENLANAIRERISEEDLEGLRHELAGRLVGITVVFLLWLG